jgi:hypothetical protein
LSTYRHENKATAAATTGLSIPSRLRAAPPPTPAPSPPSLIPSSPTDDEKDVEEEFRLLGIKSSELPLLRSVEYSIAAKREIAAFGSNGALQLKSSGGQAQSYILRIATAGAVTPTAGVAASTFVCDPSVIPLSEWTTFANLFDEVKLHSFKLMLTPYSNGSTSSGTNSRLTSCITGSFYSSTSLPANIVSVTLAGDSKPMSPLAVRPHVHRMKVPRLGFASVASPGGTTFYGCPGSIKLYATGDGTNSMMTYYVIGEYLLRGRV